MPKPETSSSSLLRDLAGLSLSPRKNRSRADQSLEEPDFSSGFSQWISLTKKRPKEHRRHRSDVSIKGDDIETLKKDLHHERKLLRRALRELTELRADRDEVDDQRFKATADLKRLREKDLKNRNKISEYRSKFQGQEETLERLRASVQTLRRDGDQKDEKIGQLTKEGAKTKSRLQKTHDKLDRERAEVSRLTKALSEVKSQRHQSSENLDAVSSLRALRTTHDILSRDYASSQVKIKTLKAENTSLEIDCTRLRADRDSVRQKLTRAEAKNTVHTQNIKDLTKAKLDLEKIRDLVQPILQIGVDIRLRNLETAREPLLNIKPAQKDRAIMLSGNIAAHRANGAVDAALFEAGLIPEDYLTEATEVFQKLYQVAPSRYGCWSPMVLRMIDCRATIATIQVQHHFKKFDTSHLRDEHERLHGFLLARQKRLSWAEFEADDKARDLLAEIEEIMERIVDLSRGKGKAKGKGSEDFQPYEYEDSGSDEPNSKDQNGKEDKVESDENVESDDSSEDDDDDTEDSESFNEDDSSEDEHTMDDDTAGRGKITGTGSESESDSE